MRQGSANAYQRMLSFDPGMSIAVMAATHRESND